MRWTNEPEKWKFKGDEIKITCPGEVDYWRNTLHGFVKDDAPFYWMYADYDFEVRLSMKGKWKYLYDQSGIMIRLDENNWIKAGIIHFRDNLYASVVFTRGNSDWSTHLLPKDRKITEFHCWVKRKAEVIEVYYSLDNVNFIKMRQGHFSEAPRLRVGMMSAAPESDGFKCTFTNFMIRSGDEDEDFVDKRTFKNPGEHLLIKAETVEDDDDD